MNSHNGLEGLEHWQRQALLKLGLTSKADIVAVLQANPDIRPVFCRTTKLSDDSLRSALMLNAWPIPSVGYTPFPVGGVHFEPSNQELPLASSISKRAHFDPVFSLGDRFSRVRNQGQVGTCTAHAIYAAIEGALDVPIEVSPAYIYNRTKHIDGIAAEGSQLKYAAKAAFELGVCHESQFPYEADIDYLVGKPPKEATRTAGRTKRATLAPRQVPSNCVDSIRSQLVKKQPVAISVPLFRSSCRSSFFRREGRMLMRLTKRDSLEGNHAMTVVGWAENNWLLDNGLAPQPGGGVFLVLNSWGEDFAAQNPVAKRLGLTGGFALMPFAYLTKYCFDAYSLPLGSLRPIDLERSVYGSVVSKAAAGIGPWSDRQWKRLNSQAVTYLSQELQETLK